MLFTVKDYQNRVVSLSKDSWFKKLLHPIFGHPETEPYFSKIKTVIAKPDIVYQSKRDIRSELFYKAKVGKGKFIDCYLVVVVKYVMEEEKIRGYVSTVMFNRMLPKAGETIWQKKGFT